MKTYLEAKRTGAGWRCGESYSTDLLRDYLASKERIFRFERRLLECLNWVAGSNGAIGQRGINQFIPSNSANYPSPNDAGKKISKEAAPIILAYLKNEIQQLPATGFSPQNLNAEYYFITQAYGDVTAYVAKLESALR